MLPLAATARSDKPALRTRIAAAVCCASLIDGVLLTRFGCALPQTALDATYADINSAIFAVEFCGERWG
jgi:hypothetical protein